MINKPNYLQSKCGEHQSLTYSKLAGIGLFSLLISTTPQVALAHMSHSEAENIVQQTSQIKGVIVDNSGMGIIGATVVVKGTTNGVVTDIDGNFTLNANAGDMLEIAYVGYKPLTIKASSEPMKIILQEDTETLDEVVVVGYGSTTKRDLIASVSTVKAEQISNVPVANLTQGLAGRSPGLIVQASGGGG